MIPIPRSKYNVSSDDSPRAYAGIIFDSTGEMRMYRDFLLPGLHDGTILTIERQVPFLLQEGFTRDGKVVRPIEYIADFVVKFACGQTIVFDFKGHPDPTSQLKRKLFWHKYPETPYYWVAYSKRDGGYRTYEYIQKQRSRRKRARYAK